jgi:hypothetical protein
MIPSPQAMMRRATMLAPLLIPLVLGLSPSLRFALPALLPASAGNGVFAGLA